MPFLSTVKALKTCILTETYLNLSFGIVDCDEIGVAWLYQLRVMLNSDFYCRLAHTSYEIWQFSTIHWKQCTSGLKKSGASKVIGI